MNHLFSFRKPELFFTFVVLFMTAANGLAQTRQRMPHVAPWQSEKYTVPNVFWMDLSGGSALTKNERYGPMAGVNLHYLTKNRRHIEFRYNYTGSLPLKKHGLTYDVSDAGYLFGWILSRRFMVMEFALGVSCVFGNETTSSYLGSPYGFSNRQTFVTVGLPVEFDIKPMCFHYFGLGIAVKGNLNPRRSYVGVGLELSLHGPNQRRMVVKE